MSTELSDLLKTAKVVNGRAASFGDTKFEFELLCSEAGLVPLMAQGCLEVMGADRLDFLHGQLSNEVKRLNTGEVRTALMLNHKGHALSQMQVVKRQDNLLLSVEGGATEQVRAQLQAHIIFDQVKLELVPYSTFSLQGPSAKTALRKVFVELPREFQVLDLLYQDESVVLYPKHRSLAGGFDLLVPTVVAAPLVTALIAAGASLVGEDALRAARIEAGIPLAETEAGEGVLPQEAGLEPFVSYTKGCYLGQEIMARIEARGKLRRSLVGVTLCDAPGVERAITFEGKRVGQLGATAEHPSLGWIGLAVLRDDVGLDLYLGDNKVQRQAVPFS